MTPELLENRVYKVIEGDDGGRKFRLEHRDGDRLLVTWGWFKYQHRGQRKASADDTWVWSNAGAKWEERGRLASAKELKEVPQIGDRRALYPWAMEER
jgi:hypothetical protein